MGTLRKKYDAAFKREAVQLAASSGKTDRIVGTRTELHLLRLIDPLNYFSGMPRKARIIVPGAVHHVMARGLDRELIFRDNVDREKMLQLVERYFLEFRCAWLCLGTDG